MSHNHQMIILPDLRERMREKEAARAKLAKAAGVCETVVHKAMNCEPIRIRLAGYINEALETKQFKYKRLMASR
jgi:hypothetical protein